MKRIVCLIALVAFSAPASARDSYFTFHGHRIHINTLRHCRSLSCIRMAIPGLGWRRDREGDGDIDTPDPVVTPAPAPAQAQPAPAPAPVQPRPLPPAIAQVPLVATRTPAPAAQPASAPTPAAVAGAQTAPPQIVQSQIVQSQIVQSRAKQETTASTPSAPPPSVGFEVAKPQTGPAPVKAQAPSAEKMDPIPLDKPSPKPVVQAPPVAAQASPKAGPQLARASDDSDDDAPDTPLGDWQTEGKNGLVHIEACGASLCGYVLNASTREKGEIILVNMKPKFELWSGNIYSRSSGNSYYGTITMKEPNTLRVEACALGKFFCSANNWTRIEQARSVRQHATSRSPSNRS